MLNNFLPSLIHKILGLLTSRKKKLPNLTDKKYLQWLFHKDRPVEARGAPKYVVGPDRPLIRAAFDDFPDRICVPLILLLVTPAI